MFNSIASLHRSQGTPPLSPSSSPSPTSPKSDITHRRFFLKESPRSCRRLRSPHKQLSTGDYTPKSLFSSPKLTKAHRLSGLKSAPIKHSLTSSSLAVSPTKSSWSPFPQRDAWSLDLEDSTRKDDELTQWLTDCLPR